ncbi:hypothetical protein H4R21_006890, partial [Coemansia helicoidea]
IDARQLCDQLRAGSWRITDDGSWRTLAALLRRAGSVPDLDWGARSPVVPSDATIAVVSALGASLRGWTGLGCGTSLGRLLAVLRFVAWLGSNRTNRRVLVHHGVAALICQILATVRSTQADVFGYAASAARDSQGDSLMAADIRSCEWWRGTASAGDAAALPCLGHSTPSPAVSAAYVLLQHAMFLCGWVFDPDRKFAAFLASGAVRKAAADPDRGFAQGDASCVLTEALLLWRQLETARPRAHFSPAVAGLGSVIGGVVLSGALTADDSQNTRVAERIAQSIGALDADEAYLA